MEAQAAGRSRVAPVKTLAGSSGFLARAISLNRGSGTIPLTIAILVNLAISACAVPQAPQSGTPGVRIAGTADVGGDWFISHDKTESGPAALAMALRNSGAEVTLRDIALEVRNSGGVGSFQEKVVGITSRYGRLAYPVHGIDAVLQEIAAGRPVIASLNLGYPWRPSVHFAVLIGYDLEAETLIFNSGRTPRKVMPIDVFKKIWEQGEYWAVVVLRPGALPATPPEAEPYLDAVKGLEYAGHYKEARKAYEVAVRRWPQSLEAYMGLGNSLRALGHRQEAAEAYTEATIRHPAAAAAHDSLARVLIELGQLTRARWAAQTAVALNGANANAHRQTLRLIIRLESRFREAHLQPAKDGT